MIDVLVGTFLGDTGAYLGGSMFGKRPLAPTISPNKTVEGLLIGMVFAILGVWIAGRYEEWLPGTHALVIGAAVALAAPVGDLFESFVKRDANIKDSGGLFGAHGGALDRSMRCCSPRSPGITCGRRTCTECARTPPVRLRPAPSRY